MSDNPRWAKLREPFPAAAVGRLPKPTKRDAEKGRCNECGGWHGLPAVHLDYVGHAAVTDRLLTVDPEWTWEPFALDPAGLPAVDRDGNLWIRLTICGVTRPGVGDGASLKEKIGDAIRNAAMRFGVALDLWAKEDLHDSRQESDGSQDPTKPNPAMTALVNVEFKRAGITTASDKHDIMSAALAREVTSWKELSREEASKVIDYVKALPDAPDEAEAPTPTPEG